MPPVATVLNPKTVAAAPVTTNPLHAATPVFLLIPAWVCLCICHNLLSPLCVMCFTTNESIQDDPLNAKFHKINYGNKLV